MKTIIAVTYEMRGVIEPDKVYWIQTSDFGAATRKAKKLLLRDLKKEGYSSTEIGKWKVLKIEIAGTIDG